METDKTYIMILRDSITNKVHVLESLLELTEEQRRIVKSDNPDIIRFDEIFDEKGRLIDMLNMLDDGFDGIYGKVRHAGRRPPTACFQGFRYCLSILISQSQAIAFNITPKKGTHLIHRARSLFIS